MKALFTIWHFEDKSKYVQVLGDDTDMITAFMELREHGLITDVSGFHLTEIPKVFYSKKNESRLGLIKAVFKKHNCEVIEEA